MFKIYIKNTQDRIGTIHEETLIIKKYKMATALDVDSRRFSFYEDLKHKVITRQSTTPDNMKIRIWLRPLRRYSLGFLILLDKENESIVKLKGIVLNIF